MKLKINNCSGIAKGNREDSTYCAVNVLVLSCT